MGPLLGAISGIGAVATVVVANLGISAGETGTYASWYVGGMGVLLGIVAVRGQTVIAWVSGALVTAIVIHSAGLGAIGNAGLVGMVVLMAAGQATARSMHRADGEVKKLQSAAIRAEEAIVRAEATGVERQERLQRVLTKALPALSYIKSNQGKLSEEQREGLLRLEAGLRDDIRGRHLINEDVETATQQARLRGVQVLLLDEGGLDDVATQLRKNVLEKVAAAINSVNAGKIVVRSPKGEKFLVTVTATRPGTSSPDLWLKF
jgi:hypothetical protein